MKSELILALAHLERMIRTYVPHGAPQLIALKELETLEFQIAFAIGTEAA